MVVDIEFVTIRDGRAHLAGYPGISFVAAGNSMRMAPLQFGPLTVPGPRDVANCLAALYPNGFSTRMYRNASGRHFLVPAEVPERAMPSDGLLDA